MENKEDFDSIIDRIASTSQTIGAIKVLYYLNEIGGFNPKLTAEQIESFAKKVIEQSMQNKSIPINVETKVEHEKSRIESIE